MTLITVVSEINYPLTAGMPTTGLVYTFPFRILQASDLVVVATNLTTGNISTLVLNSDYSVAGVGVYAGGSITLLVDWENSALLISRVEPITQMTSFTSQGAFFPELHEMAFDKLTMIAQQQQEQIGNSLQVIPGSGINPLLPPPVGSQLLGFNPAANGLQTFAGSGSVPGNLLLSGPGYGDYLMATLLAKAGAGARTQNSKNSDIKSLADYAGADPTGVTDSTAALQAAVNSGTVLVPDGVFKVSGTITVNNDCRIYGSSKRKAILRQGAFAPGAPLTAGACNMFNVNGDYVLEFHTVQLDGNGANQPTSMSYSNTDAISIPIGSLVMDHCYIHDFKGMVIRPGNVESTFGFPSAIDQYAHDLRITNNVFAQASYFSASVSGNVLTLNSVPTGIFASGATVLLPSPTGGQQSFTITLASGVLGAIGSTYTLSGTPAGTIIDTLCCLNQGFGDIIRMHKVTRGVVSHNFMIGGLSPIRGDYYCSFLTVAHNFITLTGDVGVTLALTTDSTVTGNICTYNAHNGIEIDSVHRVAVTGNTCTGNFYRGIQISTYTPPLGYNGYLDGVKTQYSATGSITSGSNQLSFSAGPLIMVGMSVYAGSTPLGAIASVTNGGVVPCVATMVSNAGATYTAAAMTTSLCIANQDVIVSGNTCNGNGYSGMWTTGTTGTLITGNRISGNNTANSNGEGGIYISGDVVNLDYSQVTGNTFNNTGYQTVSIPRGNIQGTPMTRISGNQHVGGLSHTNYPALGMFNCMSDRFLLNNATVSAPVNALMAPDANAKLGQARQVQGGNTANFIINNPPQAGRCLVYFRIRTPDGATNPSYYINLYNSGTILGTIVNTGTITLSSNPVWTEICAYVPSLVITGSCATNQLSISASPITLAAGMGVEGTGIASGTTISSVTNGGVAPCVATLSTSPGTLTATSFLLVFNQLYLGISATGASSTHVNVEEISCFVAAE